MAGVQCFQPAAAAINGRICLLFRAEDSTGSGVGGHVSRIGIAWSDDGIRFNMGKEPVPFRQATHRRSANGTAIATLVVVVKTHGLYLQTMVPTC